MKQHILSELITHKFFPLDKFMRITNLCKLMDCTCKGDYMPTLNCFGKKEAIKAIEPMIEIILSSIPEHKLTLQSLMASPVLFPMCLAMDVAQQAIASYPRLVSDHFGDGEIVVSWDRVTEIMI